METKMELSIIEKICNGRGKDAAEAAANTFASEIEAALRRLLKMNISHGIWSNDSTARAVLEAVCQHGLYAGYVLDAAPRVMQRCRDAARDEILSTMDVVTQLAAEAARYGEADAEEVDG